VLAAQVGWQESDLDDVERWDLGAHEDMAFVGMGEANSDEYVEMGGAAQGAAAGCGGGESEKICRLLPRHCEGKH